MNRGHYKILARAEGGSEESGDIASQLKNYLTSFQQMKSILHASIVCATSKDFNEEMGLEVCLCL